MPKPTLIQNHLIRNRRIQNRLIQMRLMLVCHRRPSGQARGASLIEVLIAGAIFVGVMAGIIPLYSRALRNYGDASTSVDLQARLDEDLAQIRQLGERFSWCSGAGSVTPSGSSCSTLVSGSSAYYVPTNTAGSTAVGPELARFNAACAGGSGSSDPLTAELVRAIAAQPQPQGLSRQLSLDDAAAHRLRILYTGANLSRTVVYTPPLVAWCP